MSIKSRGLLLGLLAMFGATVNGALPKLSYSKRGRDARPASVQAWYIERSRAKRLRRAQKPGASKYALANLYR